MRKNTVSERILNVLVCFQSVKQQQQQRLAIFLAKAGNILRESWVFWAQIMSVLSVWITKEQRSLWLNLVLSVEKSQTRQKSNKNCTIFFWCRLVWSRISCFNKKTFDAFHLLLLFLSSSFFYRWRHTHLGLVQMRFRSSNRIFFVFFYILFQNIFFFFFKKLRGGWQYPPTISWMNRWSETDREKAKTGFTSHSRFDQLIH